MNATTIDYEHRYKRLKYLNKIRRIARKKAIQKKLHDVASSRDSREIKADSKVNDVAGFVVEDYRFSNSYRSIVRKLPAEDRNRYESTYNFHTDKVNEILGTFGLKIVCFDGRDFDEGLPVTPLNSDEFSPMDNLVISQTIEPTVIDDEGHTLKFGTVLLDKKGI